ncbi:hypothetical protein HY637_05755 [Candidatus Woesearchaeota archaeon]|nr:hypothetical protein [Candidatus Woesearchaeota archaeon]
MQKSLIVAFVIAFFFMSTIIFDMTIDKFYPPERDNYLSSYLGSSQPSEFPARNIVLFFIHLAIGFTLIVLSFQTIHSPIMANLFAWTGLYFVTLSNYTLRYASVYGWFGGSSTPPGWTLIVQWIALIALIYLGYKLQDFDKK